MPLGKKYGGRVKGTPNKLTKDIKALAQVYGPAAIRRLADLAGLTNRKGTEAQAEATRVAAMKELLDRGYGKAKQPLEHDVAGSLEELLLKMHAERAKK
jgi:hypothetical protein